MLYYVSHITRYLYETPVSQRVNEMRLTPRQLPGQLVREAAVRVEPVPAFLQPRKDYFGNDVTALGIFEKHRRFVATATAIVEVRDLHGRKQPAEALENSRSLTWEETRDLLAAAPDEGLLGALEFVFDSPYVSAAPELAQYARPTFTKGRPLVQALHELSHRIYEEFQYRPKSTSIDTPLADVLRQRRGVCQDYAHVMIGALRSLRLAARYVSGYLRTGGSYQGAGTSHAWVSAFVPGSGWLDFDPTNDMVPSDGHVTLAWGRDYSDVTPVKGVTLGGGGETIEVEVRVQPMEDAIKAP